MFGMGVNYYNVWTVVIGIFYTTLLSNKNISLTEGGNYTNSM